MNHPSLKPLRHLGRILRPAALTLISGVVFSSLVMVAGGTAGAASASGVVAADRKLLPASVRKTNVMSDYVNIPYVPMEFYAPGTKKPEGIDIDIANAIGRTLGVKMKFTNVLFPDLFTALQSKRAQLVISGAYDAPSRRGTFEFIDYFKTGTPILTTKANAEKYKIKSFAAFCGKSVATGTGTDYIQEIQSLSQKYCGSKTSVHQILSNANAQDYLNVAQGRAVAAFDEGNEAAAYFLNHQKGVPDAGQWEEVGHSYYPTDYGIVLLKNSPYRPALQAALNSIMANGEYSRILRKWHVAADALPKATLNGGPPIP